MVGSEGFLHDHQRALVDWLGLGVVALFLVENGEIAEARGYVRMPRAEGLL